MTTPTSPVEVQNALQDLFFGTSLDNLPTDLKPTLMGFVRSGVSSVEATVNLAELVYARKDDGLPVELLQLAADAALVAANYNFHGFANDGRGAGISTALRAMKGVSAPVPAAPLAAPEPKAEYVAAAPATDAQPAPMDANGAAVEALPQPAPQAQPAP